MKYEEHYLVTITSAAGVVESEMYDDPDEAGREYRAVVRGLGRGEKAQLTRYTNVILGSAVRAK